jgi:hypothetical protein
MFEIKAGTEVRVIKVGQEWYAQNFKEWTTRQDNLFDKEQMTIDPTGIASWCPPLKGVTIGSAYADAGWYGFQDQGYIILCPASKVAYIG